MSAQLRNFAWKYSTHHIKDEGTANAEIQNAKVCHLIYIAVFLFFSIYSASLYYQQILMMTDQNLQ